MHKELICFLKKARLQLDMKKYFTLLFLCFVAFAYAIDEDEVKFIASGMPIPPEDGIGLISKSTRSEGSSSFKLFAKFDEYIALQDSMDIAFMSNTQDGFYPTDNVPEGEIVTLNNTYKPGFQVGFIANTSYDNWNFSGNYLWFRSKVNASRSKNSTNYYISPVFTGPYSIKIGSIQSYWELGIDMIDLYLSRPFFSGDKLTLTPILGLKGGWIRGHFNLVATNFVSQSNKQQADTTSRMFGIGPRLGVETNYRLGKGFSIFGSFLNSFLYADYTALSLKYMNNLGQTSFVENNNFKTFRAISDGSIGLNWMSQGKHHITLNAAYNLSVYFSQNMERALVSVAAANQTDPANLYLSGFSLGASFVF
jgi:hypothetical protein